MSRFALVSMVLALVAAMPLDVQAQRFPTSEVAAVRVLGPRGNRVAQGTVQSMDADSIVVVGDGRRVAVATSSFGSGGYRLARRKGTYGAEGLVWTGTALGIIVAPMAYCFQLFESGCAADPAQGLAGFAYGFAIGGAIGGLIGAMIPEYEDVDLGPFGGSVQAGLAPVRTDDGSWGVTLAMRRRF